MDALTLSDLEELSAIDDGRNTARQSAKESADYFKTFGAG